ncbi:MFS transporter [Sphingomonas sp. SRS2]|nr:MFS transporter [Sphingomonas sp. SRS2]
MAARGEPRLSAALPALIILALSLLIGTMSIFLFSIVQEAAKAELRLSDAQIGFIQGVGGALPLALLAVPIGRAVDRLNRKWLLVALAASWTIGLFLTALSTGVTSLLVARMFVTVGGFCSITAAISIAADLCAPTQRGSAMLVLTLGKWGGNAGAFALGGWLFGMLGSMAMPDWLGTNAPWRGVHMIVGAISLVAIIPLLFIREPARRETVAGAKAPFSVAMRELWDRRAFILPLFVGQLAVAMIDTAAGIWAAPVLNRNYGLQPQQFAQWMGLVVFGAGVIGSIVGGLAADRGHRLPRRGGILIGAIAATILSVPMALFPLAPSVPLFATMLGIFLFCGTAAGLIVSVTIAVLLPNELRGFCIGLFVALAGIIGFGVAPTLITLVSGLLGGESHLGMALALVGVVTTVLAAFAFPVAMRHAPQDSTSKAG